MKRLLAVALSLLASVAVADEAKIGTSAQVITTEALGGMASGSAASPGAYFALDIDTGFFHDQNHEINFASNAKEVGMTKWDGTTAYFVFYNPSDTGFETGAYFVGNASNNMLRVFDVGSNASAASLIADGSTSYLSLHFDDSSIYLGSAADVQITRGGAALVELNSSLVFTGDGKGMAYGGFYGDDIAWSQASAVQNTYYDVFDTDISDSSGGLNQVAHDGSGLLTVTFTGKYMVNYSVTVGVSTANQEIETAIVVNGTEIGDGEGQCFLTTNTGRSTAAGTAIIDLAASATVNISIRHTTAGTPDVVVEHISMTLVQVGGS